MAVLASHVDPGAKEFIANCAAMEALVADLHDKVAEIRLGGDEAARERHASRGKMLPRARIQALLDRSAEFFEMSAVCGLSPLRRSASGSRDHNRHRQCRGA